MKELLFYLLLFGLISIESNAQITYKIKTKLFTPEIINSYPQKATITKLENGIYDITLQVFAITPDSIQQKIINTDTLAPADSYTPEISSYLEATELIHFQLPEIKYIADTLFKDEKNTKAIIHKGLKFSSTYISYDDSLAKEIDKGNCFTLDVSTILKTKKGTCSEYTNLFIALMRSQGIPCRFITGYVSYPPQNISGSHAWAECYIKNFGWLPVDPTEGKLAYPIQIKLFAGKDYKDCHIRLLEDITPLSIELIDN